MSLFQLKHSPHPASLVCVCCGQSYM